MKILIDLQSLQTGSAARGIGRYSSALSAAIINELKLNGSEVFVLLNDSEQETQGHPEISSIQESVGDDHVIRFPLAAIANPALHLKNNEVWLSKILRERFIEALAPDVVLITSLFEFDALSTIPNVADRSYFCAAILYDLIPLSDPDHYLGNSVLLEWYEDRLRQLKHADALLSISEYVRRDAMTRLKLPEYLIKNISAGTNLMSIVNHKGGKHNSVSGETLEAKPYILYVGGFDKRKNVESLVACYAKLPRTMQATHRLVLAGGIGESRKIELEYYIRQQGLDNGRIVFCGFVDDKRLIDLYKNAHLFVFPSFDEGFGLPPLEAMALGVPTITSNCASLPEVVGNEEALFDASNQSEFLNILELGLKDEEYRARLRMRGLEQSLRFNWERSARTAVDFIKDRNAEVSRGNVARFLSFRGFLENLYKEQSFRFKGEENAKLTKLLARGLLSASSAENYENCLMVATELKVSDSFSLSVPDYSKVVAPYVFSSMLCREQHFHLPLYTYWCNALGENPRFHRKQWEFVYICQALYERGYLRSGLSAVGFGVGKEPLVSYFASCGIQVLATDLDTAQARELGWVSTNQHSDNVIGLNERRLCETSEFNRLVSFRNVDMNDVPRDIGCFDFCWSSCAFEHLGSIRNGLDFVINSARLLRPGGVAVHTTEYNISSNSKTLDNNRSFVIFRRCDIEILVKELQSEGYQVEPIDFSSGEDELERYVDLPPYLDEPHLRLELAGEYVVTSLGIIVRAPGTHGVAA